MASQLKLEMAVRLRELISGGTGGSDSPRKYRIITKTRTITCAPNVMTVDVKSRLEVMMDGRSSGVKAVARAKVTTLLSSRDGMVVICDKSKSADATKDDFYEICGNV